MLLEVNVQSSMFVRNGGSLSLFVVPLPDSVLRRRDLTVEQRLSYIKAVHCLHKLPPHDKTRAATTRFEEFQATHILLTDRIHSVVCSVLLLHRQTADI